MFDDSSDTAVVHYPQNDLYLAVVSAHRSVVDRNGVLRVVRSHRRQPGFRFALAVTMFFPVLAVATDYI